VIAVIADIARHRETKTLNHKGHEGARRRTLLNPTPIWGWLGCSQL